MTITDSARRLALVAVVAMLAALLPLSGAFAQDTGGEDPDAPVVVDLEAEDADDAVGRAVRISSFTFVSANEALLGRDDVFADSLASGSLQGGGRPLLVTPSDALDDRVVDELNRLGVETVHILGLEDAISADVEQAVQDAGFETNRFGGETRIETAVDIAETVGGDTAIVARAFANEDPTQAFADSLAAGGWAAEDQTPVLLSQTEVLTGSTRDHIADAGYANIVVVGGESAISEDVVAELEELGATVTRIAGETRFETAVEIAAARGFDDSSDAELTIIADGQGGQAWVDGFASAALSGLTPAPIVLSNSATEELPQPTADFLVDETADATAGFAQDEGATFVLRDQADNVVAVCTPNVATAACEQAAEELGATIEQAPDFTTPVSVSVTEVEAGGEVTVTITDARPGSEIVISGCGITESTTTVSDDHEGDVNLDVTIPATQEAGDCTLTVTYDGVDYLFTITVTEPAGNQTVTTRPELVRATIGTTTTATQQTASNPAGTTIVYEFDEPLSSATATNFFAYRSDNTRYQGNATVGFTAGSQTVTVRFTDVYLQTASNVANLTLATAAQGAVQTSDGAFNPEGDAPIGTASSTVGQAGTTNAPDLLTVGGFRAATPSSQTAVDFTFDEAAFLQGTPNFQLIPVNGGAPIMCTTNNNPNTTGGGTVAGGQGTTTITALCPNTSGTTPLAASDYARGVVPQGAVSDSGTSTTNLNPMQAADISNAGNTVDPDLVSAEFQPEAMSGTTAVDRVIYVFDQNVATAGASTGYNIYDAAGAPAQDNGTVVQITNNRVAVDFLNGSLSDAVGASVDANTVGSTTGVGTTNEDDEVGVANTSATNITPGQTAGPQLTAVALAEATDATGASVGFRATYTFDKDVDIVANPAGFFLWQADGDRLVAQNCTNPTADDTDNTVTCSFIATGVATSSDVAEAVLGTVAFDAVRDEGAGTAGLASNPEGGEVTTGGTGTPAQ